MRRCRPYKLESTQGLFFLYPYIPWIKSGVSLGKKIEISLTRVPDKQHELQTFPGSQEPINK